MGKERGVLTFATLTGRLLADVRRRLNNGEFTERGLARLIGVSQPHIHNVLSGFRVLTPEIGDSILSGIGASLLEVVDSEELGEALLEKDSVSPAWRAVPLLTGVLGPESPFPDWREAGEWVRLPAGDISGTTRPALVLIGADPELPPPLAASRFAMLDLGDDQRSKIREGEWYAIRVGGLGLIRQIRVEGTRLLLLGQRSFDSSGAPDWLDLTVAPLSRAVRARVVWFGRDPRSVSALAYLAPRIASS